MFTEGTILYFSPFHFKNGAEPKAKFFVVLKNTTDNHVLASLPTSKNYIPTHLATKQGCIETPKGEEFGFNCFLIQPNKIITNNNKSFTVPTYIYGHNLSLYNKGKMKEIYPLENTDYSVWGKMKTKVFAELLTCLKNSKSVKIKFIKILNS